MQFRKVIKQRIRRAVGGVHLDSDVNAAISANVGERSQTTHVSSHSTAWAGPSRPERDRDTERPEGRE
jgi:hypothetical protein